MELNLQGKTEQAYKAGIMDAASTISGFDKVWNFEGSYWKIRLAYSRGFHIAQELAKKAEEIAYNIHCLNGSQNESEHKEYRGAFIRNITAVMETSRTAEWIFLSENSASLNNCRNKYMPLMREHKTSEKFFYELELININSNAFEAIVKEGRNRIMIDKYPFCRTDRESGKDEGSQEYNEAYGYAYVIRSWEDKGGYPADDVEYILMKVDETGVLDPVYIMLHAWDKVAAVKLNWHKIKESPGYLYEENRQKFYNWNKIPDSAIEEVLVL